MKRARSVATGVALVIAALTPRASSAATRQYVIAIGNNDRPAGAGGSADDKVASLRYADDDAASMASFWRELGAETALLTIFDADSQRRFPSLVRTAQAPTLVRLRETVAALRTRFDADRRAGDDSVLVLYYSGHGSANAGEEPFLAMLDGPLTRRSLYDEVLAALPARFIHLIIDACHAEAVVRPRDLQGEVAPIGDADLEAYAARNTLRRFPHVGAMVATSAISEAHEWDEYQRGVFTFQVLSALRGAADVNRDGLVEYSEVSAFLGSANASVVDPRARLSVVARPPAVNPHAAIADLSAMRQRAAILTGIGPAPGRFFVEDERGNRLGEIRPETGFRYEIYLPSGEQLYVRTPTSEGSFRTEPGVKVALSSLAMIPRSTRTRGAVESSLRQGLFATPFGPTYYRGFVDARADLPAVDLRSEPLAAGPDLGEAQPRWSTGRVIGLSMMAAGIIGIAIGAGYGLEVRSRNDEIDHTCVSGISCSTADRSRYDNDVAAAKTARERSIVGFAAGGAALLGGVAVLYLGARAHADSPVTATAYLGEGGLVAGLGGRW